MATFIAADRAVAQIPSGCHPSVAELVAAGRWPAPSSESAPAPATVASELPRIEPGHYRGIALPTSEPAGSDCRTWDLTVFDDGSWTFEVWVPGSGHLVPVGDVHGAGDSDLLRTLTLLCLPIW